MTARSNPRCAPARARALSLRPLHQSGIARPEDDQPERDAVPGEWHEVVMRNVAQQGAHDKKRAHERSDESDADHRQVAPGEQMPVPDELVAGRRAERWEGEKKRE